MDKKFVITVILAIAVISLSGCFTPSQKMSIDEEVEIFAKSLEQDGQIVDRAKIKLGWLQGAQDGKNYETGADKVLSVYLDDYDYRAGYGAGYGTSCEDTGKNQSECSNYLNQRVANLWEQELTDEQVYSQAVNSLKSRGITINDETTFKKIFLAARKDGSIISKTINPSIISSLKTEESLNAYLMGYGTGCEDSGQTESQCAQALQTALKSLTK